MSEKITKLKYKKNGIVETIYPVTHADAIVGNVMLSKVVNVVASTAQTNFWGNPIRYKVPQTSSGNSSIVMLINAENTSSAGSEKYLGIMEMNILATGSNQTNGSNLNWLVVHGFEKENFHLKHLKSADEILLWVKPTVGNLTITILSETTNGKATNNAILIDKPALTTSTSTTIVGQKLSDSQFLGLKNTISGSKVTGKLADGVEAFTQSVGDNSDKVATTKYVDQSTPKIKTLHSKSLIGSGNVTLNASDVGAAGASHTHGKITNAGTMTATVGSSATHIAMFTANPGSTAREIGAITPSNLKTVLALNNVENKTSATIRGEITADNIPSLNASKINAGRLVKDRLPTDTVYTAGTQTITGLKTFNQTIKLYSSSTNQDFSALRIGDRDNTYGFDIKYIGTGSGTSNLLELWADNATGTPLKSISVDQTGLTTFSKTPTVNGTTVALGNHTHSGTYEPVFTKNTAFNKNFGTTAGTVVQGNDSRLSNARASNDVLSWAKIGNSDTIPTSKLPALAITDTFEVATQSAMTSLTAQKGDIAIRTDLNKTFILAAEPASTVGNWKELKTPTDAVLSVAGLTGAITSSNLKTSLSLNNVQNKSSATIRGEITSANVTSALGFTPYNSTNPSGYQKNSDITRAEIEAKLTGAVTTITSSNLTANRALISNGSGKVAVSAVTAKELGYLDGVTSGIQGQLDGKIYLKSNTDNRSVNTAPNDYNSKFEIKGLKSNSTLGITGQGSYSALLGIRGWSDSSGGNSHEFALTGNGEIYHRHGATTSWNAWDVLAKQSHLDKVLKEGSWNSSTKTLVLEVI